MFFSNIGESISEVLTKNLKLEHRLAYDLGNIIKTDVQILKDRMISRQTLTHEIFQGKIDIALIVSMPEKELFFDLKLAEDAVLKGMKIQLKSTNLFNERVLYGKAVHLPFEKVSAQYEISKGTGMKFEVQLPNLKAMTCNVCTDVLGNGVVVGVDSTVTKKGGIESYAIAMQKTIERDTVIAFAADNALDRIKFGISTKLDVNDNLRGALECVCGRSSGSLAYAIGLQNKTSRAVFNSAGTIDMSHKYDICKSARADFVVQAHLASKTYKTGISLDIKG